MQPSEILIVAVKIDPCVTGIKSASMKCHHAPVQVVVILVHVKKIVAQVSNAANDPIDSQFKYQGFFF